MYKCDNIYNRKFNEINLINIYCQIGHALYKMIIGIKEKYATSNIDIIN